MKKKFLILLFLLLTSTLIMPLFQLSEAEKDNNAVFSEHPEKPNKSIKPNSSWHDIFEKAQTSESNENSSIDDRWNFTDIRSWSNFTYIDGNKTRLIIGVNSQKHLGTSELERIVAKHNAKIVNKISIKGETTALVVELSFESLTKFVEEVHSEELTSYVEPNMKVQVQLVPNDAYWNLQWGPKKIEADWAWNKTVGSHNILVAIVDTGIDYTHPDLTANYAALGYDWVNMDADPIDDFGHGTHCAGIVAAVLNNNLGVAGLAQVRIMAEKVLDSGGGGYWDWVASGIIHATDSGANIISMSLGGYGESELVHSAVKYAYESGVLIIAAAGNENSNMKSYPAGYDEVIAVAATDQSDSKAWFSNWGDWIELAAPGVDIYSTMPTYWVTLNSYGYPMNYSYLSGTSMACPHVSGLAALAWSLYPQKSRDWLRLWLRYTAEDLGDLGFDAYYGYGRINARKAVEQALPTHELIAYELSTPVYVNPGAVGIINATVLNFGEYNETDITVQLFVNGTIVNSELIDSLNSGNLKTVSLLWNPTIEGLYNVTFYISPVSGEINLDNNIFSKYIYVGFPVKAVVLHSAGNVYSEIITNWQSLNTEWHLFGDNMIYIDYTTLNKESITYEDIAATEADVLIISCAYDPYMGWEFTDSEIEAITKYVHMGHGLIVTAGTLYYGVPNNNKLAPLFGLNEAITWYSTGTDLLHLIDTAHPLLTDVPNPLVFPQVGTAIPSDGRWDSNELVDGKYIALGHYQESAIVVRRGLVYISPWLEVIPPYYHHHLQLLYNAIIWSHYQKPEHELVVTLETPTFLEPGKSTLVNATVYNQGLNNETNVELQLLINDAIADSVLIPELQTDATYTLNYLWAPTAVEATYNLTAYAPPILGEEFTANNIATKKVRVMLPVKIAILGDYQSQLTNLLLENGITAYERDWDVITDIYEYDAVIVNRPYDPGASVFLALIEAADEYRVGLVFTSSWPGSGSTYGISLLQWYLNDPQGQESTYGSGSVYYQVLQEHPIFDGWNIGDEIYIITKGDRDHAWFWGYSGETIANLGDDATGIRGGGIAYKIRDSGNKHLLLASLAPQFYANTIHWTEEAKLIFIQGVLWASKSVKYEHDLAVRLEAPAFLMPGDVATLNATILNLGLNNETNVELQLLINNNIVKSETIPELPVDASYTMTYLWTQTTENSYNITAYAPPVTNETFVVNNKATKFTNVTQPLIHPIEGQYANYTIYYIDPGTGEEIFSGSWNFTYVHYVSPYQINITMCMRDIYNYTQGGWMIVNIFTRVVEKDSGIGWIGMWYPGWIETEIKVGSTINLLWGNATIVDNRVVLVGDSPIDCWQLELEQYGWIYTFWYDKKSGLWIGMRSESTYSNVYLILTATNVSIGFKYEHDIAVMLDAPKRLLPGTSTILNATVYNTGLSSETDLTLQLIINNTIVASEIIPELASGKFHTLNYAWSPLIEGVYNVTVYTPSLTSEEDVQNNVKIRIVNVRLVTAALISDHSELLTITYIMDKIGINYDVYNDNNIYFYTADLSLLLNYKVVVFYTDYRWITSEEQTALNTYLSYGGNLIVTGYDCLAGDTRLADVVRSSTTGDNVGEYDLYVIDATHPIMNGPYGSFPSGYHITGLFGDCDSAEADVARGAVTIAELGDGYDKIIATGMLPGKVVFWNGQGVIDWTSNLDCEAMFKNTINWMITKYEHDLSVSLEAPLSLIPGETSVLNATVYNLGLNNETQVKLQILINEVKVANVTIPELKKGTCYTLNFPWTPTIEGIYNITAYAPPVIGEGLIINNLAKKMVYVGITPGVATVYVMPSFINMGVNEVFTVNINVANISDLYAYEFQLFFNNAILECQNVTLPPNHFLKPEDPSKLFIIKLEYDNEYNATHGRVWVAMTLMAPETPKTGSGVLVRITLKAITAGNSMLTLYKTKFADSSASPITHVAINGYVEIEKPEALSDIALTAINISSSEVYEGWNVQIFVNATNLGNNTETFDVTLYYDNTSIGKQTITNLPPNERITLTFDWDTLGVELYVNHTIWAQASSVVGEINLDNNILIDGTVEVKMPGDVNGDKIIDIYDVVKVGSSFGTQPGDPLWNAKTDINQDDIIDIFDIVLIVLNLGKEY